MKFAIPITVFLLAAFHGIAGTAYAQKWADLSMTVLLDGEAPKAAILDMSRDAKCGDLKLPSDALLVDPKTKAIENIVFMIDARKTELEPGQIHPDLRAVPTTKPVLDNNKCKFVPHVVSVRAGQTLVVKNSDEAGHNAKFNFLTNEESNKMIPAGNSIDMLIKDKEKAPTPVECNIHPWMNAYVIVNDHPYISISDSAGKIKIEKLPAGIPISFRIWHESQDKSIEEVNLAGKPVKWVKGSVTLTLKEGANDLGMLLLKPDRFKVK
ncbi:MAG: methylamine utilization protein [Pirellula sp.]